MGGVEGSSAALATKSMGNRTERLAQSFAKVSNGCSQCNLTRHKSPDCTSAPLVILTSVARPRKMSVRKC